MQSTVNPGSMWDEPYLETCCRSALHRLTLVDAAGRPSGLKDGPCLERLASMGLAAERGGRFHITAAGQDRHRSEIMKVLPASFPSGRGLG